MIPGSANRKAVSVNKNMGIKGIQNQQGTTRIIYDALPLVPSTTSTQTLRFFENVNNRKFPFTNMNDNKLNIGETIVFQYFSFQVLTCDKGTDIVANILPIDNIAGGTQGLYRSDMSIKIAEDIVVKKLPLQSMYAPWNKDSKFYGQILVNPGEPTLEANLGFPHDVFHFVNPIVLPQQLELVIELQIPKKAFTVSTTQDAYLMITLEGLGSLYAPKSTY